MLAAVKVDVEFSASSTPEQALIDQALMGFWTLVERVQFAADQRQPIHQVEETLFRELLVVGRALLQAFLTSYGDGDGGPTLNVLGAEPSDPPRILPRLDKRP